MQTFSLLLLWAHLFSRFWFFRAGNLLQHLMRCSHKDRIPDPDIFKGVNKSNAKKAPFGSFLLLSVALTSNLWWLPEAATSSSPNLGSGPAATSPHRDRKSRKPSGFGTPRMCPAPMSGERSPNEPWKWDKMLLLAEECTWRGVNKLHMGVQPPSCLES